MVPGLPELLQANQEKCQVKKQSVALKAAIAKWRGKERKLILTQLGQDLGRIEKTLGYRLRSARGDSREGPYRKQSAWAKRRV